MRLVPPAALRALPLVAALAALAAAPAAAGTAEVSLDGAAVASFLAAQLPPPTKVATPLGTITAKFVAPESVLFVDGTVEARLGLRLVEPGIAGAARFRFRPEVDEKAGVVRLAVVRAVGEGPLAVLPDVAALLPAPRQPTVFRWALGAKDGARTPMRATIRRVEVREDRLVITLDVEAGAL